MGLHPALGADPLLNDAVRVRIAAAKLSRVAIGVSIVEVKTGKILCGINETGLMTPASNVKLVTTGVALMLLGPKFQFTTSLYAAGRIGADRVLAGDLVLVAGGDPALSGREHGGRTTAVFDAWAAETARFVRNVKGDLLVDDTLFDREYVHPSWPKDQLLRWYCAPVSAFALNDNCVDVQVKPGVAPGAPARVTLDPPTQYFKVVNRCTTVSSGQARAVITRRSGKDVLVISGRLTPGSRGARSPVAVADPTRFAATVLAERLAAAGVRIGGKVVLAQAPTNTAGMTRLAGGGHSLLTAIQTANKRSQNFYAEMILKTLGRGAGQPSSFGKGVQIVARRLDALGMKKGSYRLADGSGLSRDNAFSPLQLASFLRNIALSKHADAFIGSLAVSGVDGTLKRRLADTSCRGNVLAKTGHLRGVSALSGYVRSGTRLLAFSIIVNGEPLDLRAADRLQDAICRILVEWLQ